MIVKPKYEIGQRVKVYGNEINDCKITNQLYLYTDTIDSIIFMKDIVTKEVFWLYKLKNKKYLHNEKSLTKCI